LTKIRRNHRFALAAVLSVAVLALVPAALAAKGGGGTGGHKPGGGSGSGTLGLVVVSSPLNDNLPHYGGVVTFNVSTTATTTPYVRVDCHEGGVWVLSSSSGFFASYPWPWTNDFTLSWDMWHTPGATASCTATLYNGGATYATLNFNVS
jgi:hypothetical protein